MQKYVHLLFIVLTVQLLIIISLCDGVTVYEETTSFVTAETSHESHSTNPSGLINSTGNSSSGKLRKCSEAGQIFSTEDEGICLPAGNRTLPIAVWEENYSNFEIVHNKKCFACPGENNRIQLVLNNSDSEDPDDYQLFDDGSLFAIIENQTWFYNFGNFCIDYILEDNEYMPRPLVCDPLTNDTSKDASSKDEMVKPNKLDDFGMGTSILFLTVTLCLFLVTPKLRQSLADKCSLCHMVTLALAYGFSIVAKYYTSSTFGCTFIGYSTYFWILTSFFWLNVLCIDIWQVFRPFLLFKHKISNGQKFIIYCSYAFGCSLLLTAITVCISIFFPKGHGLRLAFGEEGHACWFVLSSDNFWTDPLYVYVYSVMFILLLVNVVAFVDIAREFIIHDNSWKRSDESKKHHEAQRMRFFFYLKLFLLVGLTWFAEMLPNSDVTVWIDWINSFRGVPIFIIYIYNQRVFGELKNRFMPRKRFHKYAICKSSSTTI